MCLCFQCLCLLRWLAPYHQWNVARWPHWPVTLTWTCRKTGKTLSWHARPTPLQDMVTIMGFVCTKFCFFVIFVLTCVVFQACVYDFVCVCGQVGWGPGHMPAVTVGVWYYPVIQHTNCLLLGGGGGGGGGGVVYSCVHSGGIRVDAVLN